MNFKLSEKLILAFAVILCLVAYYYGLFIDLTGDAGKYAAIARHVAESNDWINLKIHDEPYDQKPPLLFWLSALGFELGGLNNWSYKIFAVLYGFTGFYFVFRLGKTLYNKTTGELAALLLFSSEAFFLLSMDVHTDLVLQANVTLAIWQLSDYLKHQKIKNFIFAFIAIGLALMSKGPIGGAIPAFALGTHLIFKRDFKQLFHPKWMAGVAIALIVAIPAFLGLYNQFGLQGLKFFFVTNNVGRITGEYAGSNSDPYFYLHTLLYLAMPWTLFLLWAIVKEFKETFTKTKSEFLTTGGIWIFFVIASIAKGKAPHYIFTLMPLFAVITAKWLTIAFAERKTETLKFLGIVKTTSALLLIAFLLLTVFYLFTASNKLFLSFTLATSLTGLYLTTKAQTDTPLSALIPLIILMGSLTLYINKNALPQAFAYQASTKASTLYNNKAKPGEPFYNYRYPQYEIFFYSKEDAHQLYSIHDLPRSNQKSWIFTDEPGKDSITADQNLTILHTDTLSNRGMNRAGIQFINPATRQQSLSNMYLIQTMSK